MIGDTLLHYRIRSKLGEGGMGEVYLAEDTKLGRQVALKVLPARMAVDPSHLERFRREARSIAALDHPNIVTVHGVDEADGVHFITMGLVTGKTLSELIPQGGMPPDELLTVAVPLTDAVAAAHAKNIVHRDLKPANVMISEDGRVKVLDFGLARLRRDAIGAEASQLPTQSASPELTGPGTILGTLPYMSPEQVEGRSVDSRTDLFSLGVMLHEMALGRRPFTGQTVAALTSSILRDEPPSVTAARPEYPKRFARIVRRCLQKDPSLRYQSALDLRFDLEEIAEDRGAADLEGPDSAARSGPHGSSSRPAPSALRSVGGLAAALLIGAGGYWLLDRARGGEEAPSPVGLDQITSAPTQELFPSLSPDGQYVAYASSAAGNWDIYLHRIGGDNAVNLTESSSEDDLQPVFSPDGQSIAFRSERDGGGLFVMGATGESVRRVTDEGFNPDWSPDGSQLVHSTGEPIFGPYGRAAESTLRVVELADGASRLLLGRDGTQPRWSPHGHRIAYWAADDANRELFTVPVEGGEPTRIASSPYIEWSPTWSPDGRWLYFSSNRGGSMNLWRVPIDERTGESLGEPEPLTFGVGTEVWHSTVARQGDAIAYATYEERTNIQRLPLTPELKANGPPTWFTQSSQSADVPSLSRDGWIAYRLRKPFFDLVISTLDRENRLQLTDDPHRDGWPRWSPSGERLAFHSNRAGPGQIWTVGRDGSGFEPVTHFEGKHAIRPLWSPDETRLAFSATAEDDYRAYILDLRRPWAEQEIVELPIPDHVQFFQAHDWSADGKRLAGIFRDDEGGGVAVYSLERQTIDVMVRTERGVVVRWGDRGRRLLWSAGSTIQAADLESAEQWEVFSAAPDTIYSLDLTADGTEIFFDRTARSSDLWRLRLETD